MNRDFWIKLMKGRVDYASSLGSIFTYLWQVFGKTQKARAAGGTGETLHYVERMRRGLEAFTGTVPPASTVCLHRIPSTGRW